MSEVLLDESDYEGALLDYTKAAKYYNQSGDEDRYELMCHNIEDIEKSIQMNRQMEQSNRELQEKLENFQQNTKNFSQPNDEIHKINSKDISDMFEWFRKILSDDTESNS